MGNVFSSGWQKNPGNFTGCQPDKTACLHALDGILDLFVLITDQSIQEIIKK
jgi:hypothetical protein